MTTTVNLVGSGVPGLTADAITGFLSNAQTATGASQGALRSEEHTSELQSH